MTLKSWDQLPLQLRRNKKKLYKHLYDNTNISLTAWNSLPGVLHYSTRKLWDEIATKVNDVADVPKWKNLTAMQKRSRHLRWDLLYTELQGTTQRTLSFTITDDADEPAAISGAKVTVDHKKTSTTGAQGGCTVTSVGDGDHTVTVTKTGYEDYSGTKTSDSGHTSFTISLAREKRNLSITVNTGTEDPTPVEGASVAIGDITGTTDADGGCTLSNVVDGEHTITATADGYENYSATISSDSTHSSFTITMTAVVEETST